MGDCPLRWSRRFVLKVAYVSYTKNDLVGIVKKVERQAAAAREAGITNLDVFVVHPGRSGFSGNVHFVKYEPRRFPLNYYDYVFGRFAIIDRSVDLSGYDHVILRYPTADPSGLAFVQKHSVITEHHTDELAELGAIVISRTTILKRAYSAILYVLERFYGHRILARCKAVIAVTDEIASKEQARVRGEIRIAAISNGIDVKAVTQTGYKPFDGRTLDLVMLASNSTSWHGIDRLARSLAEYRGPVQIRFHVVGDIHEIEQRRVAAIYSGVIFRGERRGAALDALMREMNLAVSTLALYRKKMNEACSLKTREYVARGIPFLMAYRDPDLESYESGRACFLRFPNDGSLIPIDQIIEFATQLGRDDLPNIVPAQMRQFALDQLDLRSKILRYMRFLDEVTGSRASGRPA